MRYDICNATYLSNITETRKPQLAKLTIKALKHNCTNLKLFNKL